MQKKGKIILWFILLILFVIFTIIFSARTIHKYEIWKGHEDYLNSGNNTIEDWMPPNLIVKQSGIPKELIYNEIGMEKTFSNDRKPLSKLCSEKDLNCSLVIERLKTHAIKLKQE